MVRRGDDHGINIRPINHLARVSSGERGDALFLELFDLLGEPLRVHITQGGNAHARNFRKVTGVVRAFVTQADNGDPKIFVGAQDSGAGQECAGSGQRGEFQKRPAGE